MAYEDFEMWINLLDFQYDRMDDLRDERDEAREWARKYKRMYEETSAYDLAEYRSLEMEYAELKRKLKQATCEHKIGRLTFLRGPCPECGKEL